MIFQKINMKSCTLIRVQNGEIWAYFVSFSSINKGIYYVFFGNYLFFSFFGVEVSDRLHQLPPKCILLKTWTIVNFCNLFLTSKNGYQTLVVAAINNFLCCGFPSPIFITSDTSFIVHKNNLCLWTLPSFLQIWNNRPFLFFFSFFSPMCSTYIFFLYYVIIH